MPCRCTDALEGSPTWTRNGCLEFKRSDLSKAFFDVKSLARKALEALREEFQEATETKVLTGNILSFALALVSISTGSTLLEMA